MCIHLLPVVAVSGGKYTIMALPASGTIDLLAIQTEFSTSGLAASAVAGIPSTALVGSDLQPDRSMQDFYGRSAQGWQSFTTPGGYSWTVPAGVTSIKVLAIGGGGGGGGGTARVNNTGPYSGGGGGAGGNLRWTTLSVTPGTNYIVSVGGGGNGGIRRDGGYSAANNGSQGGGSAFANNNQSLFYVYSFGGQGGIGSTNSGNAAGGTQASTYEVGTLVARDSGDLATSAILYANNPSPSQSQLGGGYGASGWLVNGAIGANPIWSIYGPPGLYGIGNAYCYLVDVYDGYGNYVGQQGTNARTNTYRAAASGYGWGAGGGGGGRDNEYWGDTQQDGAAGTGGIVAIWWGY